MRHRQHILIVVLAVLSSIAACADPVDVKHYAAMRKSLKADASLEAVKSNPASCAGKVVEIRGRLAGTLKKDSSGSVIVSTSQYGSFIISTDKLPEDNTSGSEIACLTQVGPGGDLSLQAWTYDAELKRYEESMRAKPAPKPAASAKTTASAKPTAVASKGRAAAATNLTGEQVVVAYRKAIKQFNKKLSDGQADTIARGILGFSYRYKVDARLVCAVILAESHFKVGATSRCGAMGLGQLMPGTAAGLGVNDAYDPVENIYGSTRYIKSVLDRVSGNKDWNELTWNDLSLGLAAYNAGPGAVKRHGGIPPYKETQNYVKRVTSIYKKLCGVG